MDEKKEKEPLNYNELLADVAMEAAEAQFLEVQKRLEAEGYPLDAICRAMAGALAGACTSEYAKWNEHRVWAKKFARELCICFYDIMEHLDDCDLKVVTAEESYRAGGNGSFMH